MLASILQISSPEATESRARTTSINSVILTIAITLLWFRGTESGVQIKSESSSRQGKLEKNFRAKLSEVLRARKRGFVGI